LNQFNLYDIISCPNCGRNFSLEHLSGSGGLFCQECNTEFEINNSIPVLLPKLSDKIEMNYIEHYEKDAELFDYFEERECKATEHDEERLRQFIVSLIDKPYRTILDIGSGSGCLAEKIDFSKHNLISFDVSYKNIESVLQKTPNSKHFGIVGDALNPPFKSNSIDCIVASEVIEHLVSPKELISKMASILKPGGIFIISTPYKEKIPYYLCVHCNKMTPKNAHLHSFDENKLISYFNELNLFDGKQTEGNYGNDSQDCETEHFIFGNKALNILRTHVILKFLPFSIWRMVDRFANLIVNRPAHIIIIERKKK